MKYGLIYTVPFATLENIPCVVEIEKDGYSGKVTELTPASSPFTVEIGDEEFLYTPTRFSTAVIRIVGSDYLQSLFSTAYQEYRVTFKKSNAVVWCGFIKPELYTQDYSSTIFELELECMSAMSTLEFIDYKQNGESRVFVSLWDLLKKCISSANGQYAIVYMPHVYAKDSNDYASAINVLDEMMVSEQDFFDEDDKPMKLKEVLEEVCKFLNWTCVDWKGSLFFVDIDHNGEFHGYDPLSFDRTGSIIPELINIQHNGFAGSDHALDILPGYNKVTIKDSNYCVGELIPEETFNAVIRLVNGSLMPNPQPVTPGMRDEMFAMVRQEPSVYKLSEYYLHDSKYLLGARLYRICIYSLNSQGDGSYKPSISEFNYDNCIRIVTKNRYNTDRTHYEIVKLEANKEVVTFSNDLPCTIYSDGAFCISGDIAQSNNIANLYFSSTKGAKTSLKLICELEIGGYYWNGSKWTNVKSTFAIPVTPQNTGYASIDNTKKLGMPYNVNGYIIELPQKPLYGAVKFRMLTPQVDDSVVAVYIKNFRLEFTKENSNSDENNSDRVYENVLNEDYINELDEIEFKISSYNKDGACYSKVMMGDGYLTGNLYSSIEDTTVRPEEQLIRRIIKRYSAPRIKLTQVIKAAPDLTPLSRLYDNFMVNKRFINTGGTIDYRMNQFQCIMIEV